MALPNFLGVPKLERSTGKEMSNAVMTHRVAWESDKTVIGICYDTTGATTGRKSGAATLLENALGRNLLWLSCRHHMMEILLADAFNICFGPSNGPEIKLFKRFKEDWQKLRTTTSQLQENPGILAKESLKNFISERLTKTHERDDYLELLQLAALMVGLEIEVI